MTHKKLRHLQPNGVWVHVRFVGRLGFETVFLPEGTSGELFKVAVGVAPEALEIATITRENDLLPLPVNADLTKRLKQFDHLTIAYPFQPL